MISYSIQGKEFQLIYDASWAFSHLTLQHTYKPDNSISKKGGELSKDHQINGGTQILFQLSLINTQDLCGLPHNLPYITDSCELDVLTGYEIYFRALEFKDVPNIKT